MLDLNNIYRFCKLLKIDSIRAEFDEEISGYSLNSIELENGKWLCSLTSGDDKHITLMIALNKIDIMKSSNNIFEWVNIDENLLLSHRTVDKRKEGIIYSIICKQFSTSSRFNNELVLADMTEDRYVFTKTKLEGIIDNFNFDEDELIWAAFKLRRLEGKVDFEKLSDFNSNFSTHMNYYVDFEGGRKIKDNIYPTKTYLNGEDVSNIFDVNDGPDKLYRVFDLYRGIINSRNEKDINLINLGFLSQDAYDLRSLRGITEQEDSIVGKSLSSETDNYINYLKQLFNNKFGYKGYLQFDRSSILTGIMYRISGDELVRDDKGNIIIDEQIDKITERGVRKILKRI